MRRLDQLLKRFTQAVAVPIALATASVMGWLVPARIEVGPDGCLHPRR